MHKLKSSNILRCILVVGESVNCGTCCRLHQGLDMDAAAINCRIHIPISFRRSSVQWVILILLWMKAIMICPTSALCRPFGQRIQKIQRINLGSVQFSTHTRRLGHSLRPLQLLGLPSIADPSKSFAGLSGVSSLAASIDKPIRQVLAEALQQDRAGSEDIATDSKQSYSLAPTRLVVTLSVSGGCDSVALLHACMEWKNNYPSSLFLMLEMDIFVQVVHFNHQQRGEASDQDMALVTSLCEHYQIPCHVQAWEDYETTISSSSWSSPLSFSQDAARQWRRERLLALTQEKLDDDTTDTTTGTEKNLDTTRASNLGIILTAHHKDDSIESLALKALRGVHLLNLSGMAPISRLQKSIFMVRPWVQDWYKQDLIDYLQQRGLEWREDESNTSPKYLRNRVRNELIPLLQDLTDGAFFESRVPTWIQQSGELAADVQPRVDAHLRLTTTLVDDNDEQLSFNWKKSCRLVAEQSSNDYTSTPLVQSHALYHWMTTRRRHNFSSSTAISHETFQRVLDQLRRHPDRNDWMLELGQGWYIQRKAAMLQVVPPLPSDMLQSENAYPTRSTSSTIGSIWSWTPAVVSSTEKEILDSCRWPVSSPSIVIWVPSVWLEESDDSPAVPRLSFFETTLADYENNHTGRGRSVTFTPPWKKSSIKLRQFLRAQRIPMYQRDNTLLLVGRRHQAFDQQENDESSELLPIVAILVPTRVDGELKEWILDLSTASNNKEGNRSPVVLTKNN